MPGLVSQPEPVRVIVARVIPCDAKSDEGDVWAVTPGRQYLMNIGQILNNLPNLITLARMLMTPLAVLMIISQRFLPAFVIFILAGVSDAVDGFIAKNFDLRTELGAYLDPLADKALLISIYVSLAIYAGLPAWIAITVVSRDVMILDGRVGLLAARQAGRNPPRLGVEAEYGRADRACRLRAGRSRLRPRPSTCKAALEWTVAATTLASGGVYIAQWLDHMSR